MQSAVHVQDEAAEIANGTEHSQPAGASITHGETAITSALETSRPPTIVEQTGIEAPKVLGVLYALLCTDAALDPKVIKEAEAITFETH